MATSAHPETAGMPGMVFNYECTPTRDAFPEFYRTLILVTMTLVLGACNSSTSSPVLYYLMDAVDQESLKPMDQELSVQVLDLHIPQYLERFQIARRAHSNQLVFSDNHQWGENLRKNLLRVMARNLSQLLGTADVSTPVTRSVTIPAYTIQLFIERFDQAENGRVVLSGRFQIAMAKKQSGRKKVVTRRFDLSSLAADNGYGDMVSTMQDLFGDLCIDIATALMQLDETR